MSASSEGLYRAIFEASPDGVVVVDDTGVIVDLNLQAEELFGYARAELLGQPVEVLVPEGVREAHRARRKAYARDAHARPMGIGLDLKARRRGGGEVPVEISLSPLPTAEGTLVIATVRDMTQRNRLRDFGAGALRASEEERQRIARELHDDTAQRLSALLVQLEVLQRSASDDSWRKRLDGFRAELKEAAEGVRRIARGLRPPELEDAGVVAALRSHLRGVRESGALRVEVDLDPVDHLLGADAKLVLYRIVQEAVSNAVRHSGAGIVAVRLTREGSDVVALVEDDGSGFRPDDPAADGGGLGLLGMHERAATVDGGVAVESRPGHGTVVRVRIPAERADRADGNAN